MKRPALALAVSLALSLLFAPAAAAQNEAALRAAFEGKRVLVRIDMPGASDGIDIRVGAPFDRSRYESRMRQYGSSIFAGDLVVVTLVKLKKDLIEFHLNGGGYGTFGDDTATSVDMPEVQKSNREKDLEAAVRKETDPARKRTLQRELDDLRNARERENRRIRAEKELLDSQKRRIVAERRAGGGSRFNLRYTGTVPATISPEDIMTVLAEYVDFAPPADIGAPGVPPLASDGMPRKGMARADAERLFGRPVESSERREGALRVVTLVFVRADQRITAEFVEDVLIRYTISSK